MATGHFPNCSHNFEWYGLINHDRMITLTLQYKYDTTLQSAYPKFAYPLEISLWIRNLFTHGQTLPGRFAISSETIDRRFGVVYRDVITGSRESRVHHYHRGGPGEGCTCNHRQNGDKQHARFGKYITVYGSPKLYSGSNDIGLYNR